jgi:hypothetical protein
MKLLSVWHDHVANARAIGCSHLSKISYVKAQFLENHGGAGQYEAGLMFAEDNGWLEVSPARDMFTLTDVGFEKI